MNDPFSNLNFGKSMGRKFNTNFAKNLKIGANFWLFGKCMGPILGQNLVKVWVSFHFPSGTSLPKKNLEYPHWYINGLCGRFSFAWGKGTNLTIVSVFRNEQSIDLVLILHNALHFRYIIDKTGVDWFKLEYQNTILLRPLTIKTTYSIASDLQCAL